MSAEVCAGRLRTCEWRDCGAQFYARNKTCRFCPKHKGPRRGQPARSGLARGAVLRVLARHVRRVGPTIAVRNISRVLPDLAPQTIARILTLLVGEGLLQVEGSEGLRRYRYVGPPRVLDDALQAVPRKRDPLGS